MKGSASLEAVWLAAGDGLVIEGCQVFSRTDVAGGMRHHLRGPNSTASA